MAIKKDELISGAELARRLKVTPVYITNNKAKLKSAKCMFGKKYYFEKSSLLLGKNPNNPHESYQKVNNTKPNDPIEKPQPKPIIKKEVPQKKDNVPHGTIENDETLKDKNKRLKKELEEKLIEKENRKIQRSIDRLNIESGSNNSVEDKKKQVDELELEILETIADEESTLNIAVLNGLKTKAAILKEFKLSIHQSIKNKQLDENLYDRESVIKIINIATSSFRKSLLNLANNYATSLEGMTKLEIKEYVLADINKILEDFQAIGKQFE